MALGTLLSLFKCFREICHNLYRHCQGCDIMVVIEAAARLHEASVCV